MPSHDIVFITTEDSLPDPIEIDHSTGLVAIGGDLKTERLKDAYNRGMFPWYSDGEPIGWWSPDPRMVFDLYSEQPMKISKSLRQSIRNRGYEVRWDTDFVEVLKHCAEVPRKDQAGTWLTDEMRSAYLQLYEEGFVKCVSVYKDDELIGGLYGVDLVEKGVFCGESMFSLQRDASKIALAYLVDRLRERNYKLIDAQVYNDHLASLGAVEISKAEFLEVL